MVASIVRRPWYRFRANGAQVELAADPVQNEALEGVITTVLDVELASEITLATNVTADLYAIEQDAATITAQFGGRVNQIPADSYPNRVGYLCTGPLARLRRVTVSGRNLTGMTDGEAVQEILDSCNVDFDPADIQDAGYVLGAQTAVHWVKDQPGHELIAELDRVFGMATIEVGAGRVVRFAYDRAPSASDISVTYTRGVDAEFWRNSRTRGDLDAIVNVVQVTGASWEGTDGCTRTVWARGVADNEDLGEGVRNRSFPFPSDFIQDEALAGEVATRLERWGNRVPDLLTLVALNDQNVSPGDVIGVKDQAYGIGLTAVATATPYLVLTIARRGDEMTLTCVGGAAGATGTITTGVEKVCNQTSSDVNIPGLFDPPAISLPPAIAIGTYDPGTDGAPGDPPGGGGLLIVENWVEDSDPGNHSFGNDYDHVQNKGAAHNTTVSKATGEGFTLTGTVTTTPNNSVAVGMAVDGLSFNYLCTIYAADESGGAWATATTLDDETYSASSVDYSDGSIVNVTADYDGSTLTCTFDDGMVTTVVSQADPTPAVGATLYPSVRVYSVDGTSGGADIDDLAVT